MDNEVIIHWATVLLKWVSSFKVTLQYCLFYMITISFLDTIYFSLQFSPSLLCYSHFVLYDKMDAEASSESLWFCKGMVVFGFTLLNLFHCIFFYQIFPAAKMSFTNVDRYRRSISPQRLLGVFSHFFVCGKIKLIFFHDYFMCF